MLLCHAVIQWSFNFLSTAFFSHSGLLTCWSNYMPDISHLFTVVLIWLIQGDEYMSVECKYNKLVYIIMLNLVVLPIISLDQYPIILVLIIMWMEYSPSSPYNICSRIFVDSYVLKISCAIHLTLATLQPHISQAYVKIGITIALNNSSCKSTGRSYLRHFPLSK